MINFPLKTILFIPVFVLSFFLCIKNTHAVEQLSYNNIAYNYFLNFHSLEFSNDNMNKKFYQYFKYIDFDIYNSLDTRVTDYLSDKKWFVSFIQFYNSSNQYEYNFYEENNSWFGDGYGLFFKILYIDEEDFDDNTPFIEYKNNQFRIKNIENYHSILNSLEYDPITDNIFIHTQTSLNHTALNPYFGSGNPYSSSIFNNLGRNPDTLNSVFYQSNFYINYEHNQIARPFSADLINLNQSGVYLRYSDRPFIGGDTLSNMLLLGDGQPLYAGYDYFTGNFNYGIPYTDDYDRVYLYGNTNCYLKANNDYFSATENEKLLYVKYANILSSFTDKLVIARYNNIADFSEFINYDDPPSNVLLTSYDTSSLLKTSNDFIKTYIPLTDNDDILEFSMTRNNTNMSNSLVVYYNKNIYQYSCINNVNTDEVAFVDGSTYIKGDRVGSSSVTDKLSNIYDFLLGTFNQIKQLFSKIATGFTTLGGYIQGIFEDLLTFTSSFTFIGTSISLFFSQMPVSFIAFFTIAFTITILGIIIKVIL